MKLTGVILVVLMCLLGIYDAWAFLCGGEASTVSAFMKYAGIDHPAVIAVVFYLCGHWFSPMKCPKCAEKEKNEQDK
jgi:hypothetical protein